MIVDITTYSETGYVGQDPTTILTRLLHAADDNPLLASIGIVCLDEFDKIAVGPEQRDLRRRRHDQGRHRHGRAARAAQDARGVRGRRAARADALDLWRPHRACRRRDIAFIAAGAFSGFQQVARRRGARDRIGFGREAQSRSGAAAPTRDRGRASPPEEVENIANFQAYGFLPELMARFTRVVPFKALDAATLKDILRTNVIERLTREFEDEGFELVVSRRCSITSSTRACGARPARAAWRRS